MKKNIILTSDFLFHQYDAHVAQVDWFFNLIKPAVNNACGVEFKKLQYLYNDNYERFSRDKFFALSGITNLEKMYFSFDATKISQESIDYLKSFISDDSIIFGFELGLDLRKILDKLNITFINAWVHPFKLFDDLAMMFNTNNKRIFDKLNKFKIPRYKYELYANYWKTYLKENNLINDFNLEHSTALFVGQTHIDKSIEDNGVFLNITNYEQELKEMAMKKYRRIYYAPHPFLRKQDKKLVNSFIKNRPYIKNLENMSTYALLASDKITKVIAISSSVLFEAQFFDKKTQYLYKPLFNIDGEFDLNTFISVYNDFFNPKFFAEIFDGIFETNKNVANENYFAQSKNLLRNIKDQYWGYAMLDDIKKLKDITKLKDKNKIMIKITQNNRHKIINIFGLKISIKKLGKIDLTKLDSGERQVAKTINEVRQDHIERYKLFTKYLNDNDTVLDLACGIGYGSFLIAKSNNSVNVSGIDISKDAIDFANKYYKASNNTFLCADALEFESCTQYDKIVSFETIEHLKEDAKLLAKFHKLLKDDGTLFLSTPNEKLMPHSKKFPFHVKHYTPEELQKLLHTCGFEITEAFSQENNTIGTIKEGYNGVFTIVVCKKLAII